MLAVTRARLVAVAWARIGLSRGDLGIGLIGIGGPVADGDTDQAYRDTGVLSYQGEQFVLGQAGLMRAS